MKRRISSSFAKTQVFAGAFTASLIFLGGGFPIPAFASAEPRIDVDKVFALSLDELLYMQVTSVSKRPQQLKDAAAAIHVITQEDIRRSGARSIPEALRLAPGLQVARINSNSWAISARGFNSRWANKLLVLIDGRSVYVPSFSGVIWEQQDLLLADIERIEVVRGPGATVWGANAVNGVINIITRSALDTNSALLGLRVASTGRSHAQFRYGRSLGENTAARVYVKHQKTDELTDLFSGNGANDDWNSTTAGFRVDSAGTEVGAWKLQGDVYHANINTPLQQLTQPAPPYVTSRFDRFDASGWNVLGAWSRHWKDRSTTSVQLYYDHVDRDEPVFGQAFDTVDLEVKQELYLGAYHRFHFGLGYRYIDERYTNTYNVAITPDSVSHAASSAFVQDEITLLPERLTLTVGAKVEHYEVSGSEVQPNVRLLGHLNDSNTLWLAASRAVRTPSRIERRGRFVIGAVPVGPPPTPPVPLRLNGDPDVQAVRLTAYEIGYRGRPGERVSIDVAAFLNDYDDVVGIQSGIVPFTLSVGNGIAARSRGVEAVVDWYATDTWRLVATYSYLDTSAEACSIQVVESALASLESASPRHQISVRSATDLGDDWSVDLWAYWTSAIRDTSVAVPLPIDARTSLNIRVARTFGKDLRFAIRGQDLFAGEHPQFFTDAYAPAKMGAAVYAEVTWGR